MDDKDRTAKSGRQPVVLLVLIILVALLVLYPLSAGPVVYLQTSGWIVITKDSALGRFYGPLIWVEMHCPHFGRAMNWYTSFWQSAPAQPD